MYAADELKIIWNLVPYLQHIGWEVVWKICLIATESDYKKKITNQYQYII